jgi:hypothetical protein
MQKVGVRRQARRRGSKQIGAGEGQVKFQSIVAPSAVGSKVVSNRVIFGFGLSSERLSFLKGKCFYPDYPDTKQERDRSNFDAQAIQQLLGHV